jgi:hypothetical protein
MSTSQQMTRVGLPTAAWLLLAVVAAIVLIGQVGRGDVTIPEPDLRPPALSAGPTSVADPGVLR